MFSDNNLEDLEKTTKMNEEPASKPAKPAKKPGDWVTAPMPAAPKSKAQPKPEASPTPPPAGAAAPMPAAPPSAAQPVAPPPAYGTPPSASGGGFGSFLSNVGINDPNMQKWVLIGSGVLVLLCCACICLVFGLPFMSGFIEGFSGGGY